MVTDDGSWWWTPGGRPEGSETYEEALARELREELRIQPTFYRPYHTYRYWAEYSGKLPPHGGEEASFLVEFDGKLTPDNVEINQVKWCDRTELQDMIMLSSIKEEILTRLVRDDLI